MVYYLKRDIDCILSLEKKTIESLLGSLGEADINLNEMSDKELDNYSDYVSQMDSVAGALVFKYSALRRYVSNLRQYQKFEVFDGYMKNEPDFKLKGQ